MNLNNQYIQKKIKLKPKKKLAFDFNSSRPTASNRYEDLYIPILLTRTFEIIDYVDIKKDEKTLKIERQEINPFFIEMGIFEGISRIKTNSGDDLTIKMIEYIEKNIENVQVLEEYKLGYMESLLLPTTSRYYGKIGLMIDDEDRKETRPGTSKVILEGGSPYDGIYTIEFDYIDANEKIGGFFCTPAIPLSVDSYQEGNWMRYRPNETDNITIKLVDIKFQNEAEIRQWFSEVGYNELLEQTDVDSQEELVYYIDKIETVWSNLISKAAYYNIDVNR